VANAETHNPDILALTDCGGRVPEEHFLPSRRAPAKADGSGCFSEIAAAAGHSQIAMPRRAAAPLIPDVLVPTPSRDAHARE
jgi:hypothetical protein